MTVGEPIEVRITEWNAKGLLTRIEGLRAFLPKGELLKRVNSFTELKENEAYRDWFLIKEVYQQMKQILNVKMGVADSLQGDYLNGSLDEEIHDKGKGRNPFSPYLRDEERRKMDAAAARRSEHSSFFLCRFTLRLLGLAFCSECH
ncbi:hypothetical protein Fmac_011095 [Flemingia macrophylla]|uniref:S1 motif domain-containing protein n=1 Tax=Flemingia macrophylla TaxID=520843 RepID=A0ABD1MLK0_9FABA